MFRFWYTAVMVVRLICFMALCFSVQAFGGRLVPLDTQTHYTVLGVTPNSSPVEIRKAYTRLIREFHPDLNPEDSDLAREMTVQLNESYRILSNAVSKAEYDQTLSQVSTRDGLDSVAQSANFREDAQLGRFTFSDALYQTPVYLRFKAAMEIRVRGSLQISGSGSASELADRLKVIYNRMGFFSGLSDEGRKALVAYDTLELALFETGPTRGPHLFLAKLKSRMRYDPLAAEGLLLRVAFSSFSDPRFDGEAHRFAKDLAPAVWLDMKAKPGPWESVLAAAAGNLGGVWFQQLMIRLDEVGVNRRFGFFSRLMARTRASSKRLCERALGS